MKKNLYFRTVYRRENIIKIFFHELFLIFASYPKLLIEVFTRKNFGQRYFSLTTALSVAFFMIFLPRLLRLMFTPSYGYYSYDVRPDFWSKFASWYIFLGFYLYFVYLRWKEVKRNPSVFDFGRFSLYTGDLLPSLRKLKFFGKIPSVRAFEIFIEPAPFFFAGLILCIIGQPVGYILIIASICYAVSYAAQYNKGDDFVMDKIDEMIMNDEMEKAFVNDMGSDNTRGVRFYARKPKAKTLRQKLTDSFVEDDVSKEEITYAN